jgi:HTH-type transcriptional regulator / antitoxin HigA
VKPFGSKYRELIERFPLRPIKTEEDSNAADVIQTELFRRADNLSEDERDYLDVLNVLIRNYDQVAYPSTFKRSTPLAVLKSILEDHEMKQADLANLLHSTLGRAGEILNGRRKLSQMQIAILADRFCLDAAVFLPAPKKQAAKVGVTSSIGSHKTTATTKAAAVTTGRAKAASARASTAKKRTKSA